MGTWCANLVNYGPRVQLDLCVARYPIDLHTHDDVSYWPPFVIEGWSMVIPPSCKSVRGPILETKSTMHSGVIMLTFAPVSKRTGIHFPSIIAYPTLSLPNQ